MYWNRWRTLSLYLGLLGFLLMPDGTDVQEWAAFTAILSAGAIGVVRW